MIQTVLAVVSLIRESLLPGPQKQKDSKGSSRYPWKAFIIYACLLISITINYVSIKTVFRTTSKLIDVREENKNLKIEVERLKLDSEMNKSLKEALNELLKKNKGTQ